MELSSALDWLYSTQLFGIKLGLDNTADLIRQSGAMPREGVCVVHVAGTNGKGSTCAMIEAMARAGGMKTGLFTSPHLVRFSERIRVDGREIGDADLLRHLREIRTLAESRSQAPTFFELALAIALNYFAEQAVDFLILETGLGGRLDATNAVPKDIAVLTPVALDHQQYLGGTLEEIAFEKASIIAADKPVVTAPQQSGAMVVIERMARERHAGLIVADPLADLPPLSLPGAHQTMNASVAVETLRALGRLPGDGAVAAALAGVSWPGRFEWLRDEGLVFDGAHNPHAVRSLVDTWKAVFPGRRTRMIFAASADKHIDEMIDLLGGIVDEWHLVPCASPRILPPEDMAARLAGHGMTPAGVYRSLDDALSAIPRQEVPLLVSGSLFLVGEVKAALEQAPRRATMQ